MLSGIRSMCYRVEARASELVGCDDGITGKEQCKELYEVVEGYKQVFSRPAQ